MNLQNIQKHSKCPMKISCQKIRQDFNTVIRSFDRFQELSFSEFNKKLFFDVFDLIPEAEKGSYYRLSGERFVPLFSKGYDEAVLSRLSFSIEDLFVDFECSNELGVQTRQVLIEQRDTRRFDPETLQVFKALGTDGGVASLYAPLKANGIIIGLICLENFTNKRFSAQAVQRLNFYAHLISSRIKNHINQNRISQMYHETVAALVSAIEINDPYTEGHGRRVSHYAKHLAEMLNLPQDVLADIETAGLLHDIGKLGIPKEILNKPDKLTESELQIIKEHPGKTWKILREVSGLERVCEYAFCHHECYDGSGYPRGLKGQEIPYPGQILAVADTFDAMTSARAYRKAMSVREAADYILGQSGRQFEAELARTASEMLPMIHSVYCASSAEPDQ